MEKTADLQQMVKAIADPAIRQWLGRHGLIMGDFSGQRNLMDVIDEASYQKRLNEALYGAAQKDRPSWERLVRGFATLTGNEWTPELQTHTRELSGDFAKVAPYLMRWAPDVWDKLHGSTGSVASLTHAIAEARKNDPTYDPRKAYSTAAGVFDELYGSEDPMRHRGYTAAEMGKIYQEAAKRGLIDTSGSPENISKSLMSVVGPLSAVRDSLGRQGIEVPVEDAFNVYDNVAGRSHLSPQELELQLRQGDYFQQMGAPSAYGAALMQRGGLQGSGSTLGELVGLDNQLRQQAASSPMGNIAAATARAQAMFGLPDNTPGAKLLEQINSGQMPSINGNQWIQMMEQSGIDASTAAQMLGQSTQNATFLKPEHVNAVRSSQYALDLAPQLQSLPAGASKTQQILQQGEADRIAQVYGYRDSRQMQQLHGPAVDTASGILDQANQQAATATQLSPFGRSGPVARTMDVIRNATPQTGIKDIVTQGLFNVVPANKLPKASLGQSVAKGIN